MKCIFCNKITDSEEFCSICGKSFAGEEEQVFSENSLWDEEVIFIKCSSKRTTLTEKDVINVPGIKKPTFINEKEEKVYFKIDEQYIDLYSLILSKKLTFSDVFKVAKGILKIMKNLEDAEYILDEVSIDDFEINKRSIEDICLRQTRRISKDGDILNNYPSINNISCPEKSSKKKLSKSSNVYLFGKIFVVLLTGKHFQNLDEERFYLYNILLFKNDVPYELHEFLNKVTSIYDAERYKSIEEVIEVFNLIENKATNFEKDNGLNLTIAACTDVGIGKYEKMSKETRHDDSKDDFNEDMFYYDTFGNKSIMAVGDGISIAKYGSGKRASSILKSKIEKVWSCNKSKVITLNEFKKMVEEICRLTCDEIISNIDDKIDKSVDRKNIGGVMATTLVVALMIDNRMYYCSIGDSYMYISNPNFGLSLLTSEENVGNDILKNEGDWNRVSLMDNKDHISNYIGKCSVENGELVSVLPKIVVNETYLKREDTLLMCTDGIIDYILPVGSDRNIWARDTYVKNILINSPNNLSEKCQLFVDNCNKNGGGDNLTILLARFN